MVRKEHLSRGEEVERAAEIRAKKERGEALTHHEAGVLSADVNDGRTAVAAA